MSHSQHDERPLDDLQEVASALCDQRPTLDPLELDRVKLTAMRGSLRSSSSTGKRFAMRSRLTTVLAVGFLTLGTGGTLALAGGGNGGGNNGNASETQYRACEEEHLETRPGNGFGDKNHCHTGPPGHQ
jgi:hypothetical protein